MFARMLLLLAGGMFGVLAICPIRKVAWQFVRLVAAIPLVIAITLLAWWALMESSADGHSLFVPATAVVTLGLIAFAVVSLASLLVTRPSAVVRWLRGLALCGGIAGLLAGVSWPAPTHTLPIGVRILTATGHLFSALLLGSVTVAWLLGHRYLTATEMTIDPLRRAVQVLMVALGARWVFVLALLGAALAPAAPVGRTAELSSRLSADWLMVAIRIGVGLVLPSVFAYMAWDCVKLRSTQSATGILFFMSIFVVIGELSSQYLTSRLGWPV